MRFYLLPIIATALSCLSLSVNGRTLSHRIRRVAGNDYYAEFDKPTDSGKDYNNPDDEDYGEYADYDDYGEMFACFEGSVEVAISLMCDGYRDCMDGSDEVPENCEEHGVSVPVTTTTSTTTTASTTTTTTAKTLPPIEPSVRKPEDYDYGDACTEEEFQCASDVSICLPKSQVCDGIHDCPDKEDEENCTDRAFKTTLSTTTTAKTPVSILGGDDNNRTSAERKQRLPANITEISCSSIHAFQCRSRPGDCVPRTLLCDGFFDCPDGSDEERCTCETGEFACLSGKCIDATTRCDGTDDCGDFSDEILGCVLFLSNDYDLDKIPNKETEPLPLNSTTEKPLEVNSTAATGEGTSLKLFGNKTKNGETTVTEKDTQPTLVSSNDFYFQICDFDPCANGGKCYDNEDSFTCTCKPGFTGPTCLQKCKEGKTGCNAAPQTKTFRNSYLTILTFFVLVAFFN